MPAQSQRQASAPAPATAPTSTQGGSSGSMESVPDGAVQEEGTPTLDAAHAEESFTLNGESHELTASWMNGVLDVTMASLPKPFKDKVTDAIAGEEVLIGSLPDGDQKNERVACKTALEGLESWYDDAKKAIVTVKTDRDKIGDNLKGLLKDLMKKVVAIGTTYGLTDFVHESLGIDVILTKIDNLVHKELRKHVGDPGVMGDGHNNTATAAEALGVVSRDGVALTYNAEHKTRTENCLQLLTKAVADLDALQTDSGLDVTALSLYQDAKDEIADCDSCLSDPVGYLAGKGYEVDGSGDFHSL